MGRIEINLFVNCAKVAGDINAAASSVFTMEYVVIKEWVKRIFKE